MSHQQIIKIKSRECKWLLEGPYVDQEYYRWSKGSKAWEESLLAKEMGKEAEAAEKHGVMLSLEFIEMGWRGMKLCHLRTDHRIREGKIGRDSEDTAG